MPSAPSTPQKNASPSAPAVDSPGTWRHPRLNEITRRRNATTFTDKNVKQIVYNIAALMTLWLVQAVVRSYTKPVMFTRDVQAYMYYAYLFAQSVPFLNIGAALLPLIRPADDLADIPLSEEQRKLLGLPPSSAPATPNSAFSTPPRYARTPSLAGSVGSRASFGSSPLSGRNSPMHMGSPSLGATKGSLGSPFSLQASPLQNKMGNSLFNGKLSFGASSGPLGNSPASGMFAELVNSSPTAKRTSVGLNNKWLYEKARQSSGSGI